MTLVICNGNPKAGRHALVKTVELLGTPWDPSGVGGPGRCISGHWPTHQLPPPIVAHLLRRATARKDGKPLPAPDFKHIHIVRHPRNMLVSWVRFTRAEFAPGYLIAAFKAYYGGKPIYKEFLGYRGWLEDPEVLTVRFEELTGDEGETAARIAGFLDVPLLSGAVERRLGGTVTWTGELSDWTKYWSDEIEAAWREARGPEIERMFGYA
jgi:hypothetical protein